MLDEIVCLCCGQAYPSVGLPYCCPSCGGVFDYRRTWKFSVTDASLPGIWPNLRAFGWPPTWPVISLGEGNTPLVWTNLFGRQVAFKCEFLNPSGSFKDRGSAALVSALAGRGVRAAVEDSSGNAGASFAAYAARAGIAARVYAPASASGPKRMQIETCGAELVSVPGPRSAAAQAVRLAVQQGAVYASHAWLPFNLPGYATLAVELVQQVGKPPGAVILPVGQGGLLLGMARGFRSLKEMGMTAALPQLVAVQAKACAPLWSLFTAGHLLAEETPTLAEGVRVTHPVRAEAVVSAVRETGGRFVAVDETEILPGRDQLARRGLYVEPTSALVWRALELTLAELLDPVVVILTGSGLKTSPLP